MVRRLPVKEKIVGSNPIPRANTRSSNLITMDGRKRYVIRHPARRRLTNKLTWIKRKYGSKAKEYFLDHPYCGRCGEKRLACLAVHHKHNKGSKEFETLCSNCHAAHHGGDYTIENCSGMKILPDRLIR